MMPAAPIEMAALAQKIPTDAERARRVLLRPLGS